MNKLLSQAIKKAVSEFSPEIQDSTLEKRPDLFSLNNETEYFKIQEVSQSRLIDLKMKTLHLSEKQL